MELAVAQGFDVQVVALPKGTDPADDPAAFEQQLRAPVSYPVHRVRLEHERATRPAERVRGDPDVPRLAARLARAAGRAAARRRPPRPAAGDAGRPRACARQLALAGVVSPRLLDAGSGSSASALAGVAAHPKLARILEELGPEHFDDELHRRARAHLLGQEAATAT